MIMRILMLVAFVLCMPGPPAAAEVRTGLNEDWESSLAGTYWNGELSAAGMTLTLGLEFEQLPEQLRIFLDSPDQGVEGIPATDARQDNKVLILSFASLAAELRLSIENQSLSGVWVQAGQEVPITFSPAERAGPPERPQTPKPPFPYQEHLIRFPSANGDFDLAGTLLVPDDPPAAAVVLVSGSGPQDRDESIAGHRPFLVLADHLARNGIAVLRYDDRGVGESGGNHSTANLSDFIDDAASAVNALRANQDIGNAVTGMIGHSEGALIAPAVANREQLDLVVLLAAPGIPATELIPLQQQRILEAGGVDPEAVMQSVETTRHLLSILENEPNDDRASQAIRTLFERRILETATVKMTDEQIRQAADEAIRRSVNPWFREMLSFDPVAEPERIQARVLALYGGLDLQVPPDRNAAPLRNALSHLPTSYFVVEMIPGLNHLFQPAGNGHPAEYATIETTMSPVVLTRISEWIRAIDQPQ